MKQMITDEEREILQRNFQTWDAGNPMVNLTIEEDTWDEGIQAYVVSFDNAPLCFRVDAPSNLKHPDGLVRIVAKNIAFCVNLHYESTINQDTGTYRYYKDGVLHPTEIDFSGVTAYGSCDFFTIGCVLFFNESIFTEM